LKNTLESQLVTGNYYNKYETKNIIEKYLMSRFFGSIANLLRGINYTNILDVGCGEGYEINQIYYLKNCPITGLDIGEKEIEQAKLDYPHINFIQGSSYDLPFEDNSYDLVVSCEMLEHLDHPEQALKEIKRVSNGYVLFSVPREPLWRILNIARGKYLSELGNTPGHVGHWGSGSFVKFIGKHFEILDVKNPYPWTMVLGKIKE